VSVAPLGAEDARKDHDFVFIVAYARSGSTLLQALMNACPGVSIRGENNNALYHLFRSIRAVEEAKRDHGKPFTAAPADEPWHGAHRIEPRFFEARALTLFLRRVLTPPAGARVIGFKEIRYTPHFIPDDQFAPYMSFLLDCFPRSKIVFNSRRAADVAASAFIAQEYPQTVHQWVNASDARFAAFAKTSDRVIHMRYEDWVADPAKVHAMLDFLGLDWTPEGVQAVMAKPLTHGKRQAP
jgi:Sulfotransferase family